MRNDQTIYNDIGKILLSVAPESASEVKLWAELSPEDDHCKCEFDFLDRNTKKLQWFSAGAQANNALFDLLVELRNYYVESFKSKERPFWHSCEVTLDVDTLKIHFDFKYD